LQKQVHDLLLSLASTERCVRVTGPINFQGYKGTQFTGTAFYTK
jgi:hypothetical protein